MKFLFLAIFTHLFCVPVYAQDIYLGLVGGSTKDDNKEHYLEHIQMMYRAVVAHGQTPILAFSNGPNSLPDEGVRFDYQALFEREYGDPSKVWVEDLNEPIPFMSFPKDFNKDGKNDVQFSGKIEGMHQSILYAISQLTEGSTLNIMIADHGGMGNILESRRPHITFDTENTVAGFSPYTLKNLPYPSPDSDLSYQEIYEIIQKELNKKGLLGKVSIRMDAHNCFGGGVVGLTKHGVCATATNVGTELSSGIPNPQNIPKPPPPLSDLRDYQFGGYWKHYYTFLESNPKASQMDAFWYSTFRDLANTPVSSLDYVVREYLVARNREEDFKRVFEERVSERFYSSEFANFESLDAHCIDQNVGLLSSNIEELITFMKNLPLAPERQASLEKYQNLLSSFQSSSEHQFFTSEEARLLSELEKGKRAITIEFGLEENFLDLEEFERYDKEQEIFSKFVTEEKSENSEDTTSSVGIDDPSFAFLNTDEYKNYSSKIRRLNDIAEQIWLLKKHHQQILERFHFYFDFIKNSNDEEFSSFQKMEACLEKPF